MKIFYSVKRLLLLISIVILGGLISAQNTKPKAKKTIKQFPRPGVENQHRFDSLKNMLDQQRWSRKEVKNPRLKK
ncbi:MAG: hypothetical protein EBZ58_01010 [Bacteroidetes bacterium]|nr:hypothetical protein [Bacteroidota bacterium]